MAKRSTKKSKTAGRRKASKRTTRKQASKKKSTRKGKPAAGNEHESEPKICQIVVWMTQGHVYSNLPSLCSEKLGVEVEEAQTLIKEARRRVTRASYTNRDLELGTAINRCNKIYLDNLHDKPHVAMTAQKELNKLLKLYDQPVREGDEDDPDQEVSESSAELEAIGDHLLPLGLAPEDYPLSEHARIAAEWIRNQDD